jgi:hypothetical protein
MLMAEEEGFEPSVRIATHTRFPSVPIKPLLHSSRNANLVQLRNYISKLLQKDIAGRANKELNYLE